MAVSTRSDLTLWKSSDSGELVLQASFDFGCHGVVMAASGRIFASLGVNGLLSIESRGEGFRLGKHQVNNDLFNFYKTISLGSFDKSDVLASAGRRTGLATIIEGEKIQSIAVSKVSRT